MAKFDRYMLSQLLLFFGFFSLVLVAVFWISRAVGLFDRLIADGQSVFVFLEFTALGLPRIINTVVPIASFAASVYVTNRLTSESELTVMQSIGSSPWRLARPVFLFGCITGAMIAVLAHVLMPMANAQLNLRQNEVNEDTTARLLIEGTFVHPADGVTLYTRDIDESGVLQDVFLSDRRGVDQRVIYTAKEAYLLRENDKTLLIMLDGTTQRLSESNRTLAVGRFTDSTYDITNMVIASSDTRPQARSLTTFALMQDWRIVAQSTNQSVGYIAQEFHSRFAQPIFTLAAALFGFAALIVRGFSRFGMWREVFVAFVLLLTLNGLGGATADLIRDNPEQWPLAYFPATIGLLLALISMWLSANPIRVRRRGAA